MPVDDTSVFSFSPTCWVLAILARLGNVGVVNVKPGRPSRWRATSQHADGPVAESAHSRTRTNRRNFIFGLGLFAEQIVVHLPILAFLTSADRSGCKKRVRMNIGTGLLRNALPALSSSRSMSESVSFSADLQSADLKDGERLSYHAGPQRRTSMSRRSAVIPSTCLD